MKTLVSLRLMYRPLNGLFPFLFNVLVCLMFSLIKFVLYMQFFHMSFSICNFFEIDINDSHLNHKHYFAYKFVKYRHKMKNEIEEFRKRFSKLA